MSKRAERIRKLDLLLDWERVRAESHSIQPGRTYLTESGLDALRRRGTEAMSRLNESAAKHERRRAIWDSLRTFFRRLRLW